MQGELKLMASKVEPNTEPAPKNFSVLEVNRARSIKVVIFTRSTSRVGICCSSGKEVAEKTNASLFDRVKFRVSKLPRENQLPLFL